MVLLLCALSRDQFAASQELLCHASNVLGQSLLQTANGKNAARRNALACFVKAAKLASYISVVHTTVFIHNTGHSGVVLDCSVRDPRFKSHRWQSSLSLQPLQYTALAQGVHPYCHALVDSTLHPLCGGKMNIIFKLSNANKW